MTDVLPEVAESLEHLYPVPDVNSDWDDVVASADARRKRPSGLGRLYSRRRLVALAAAMLVGVLAASALATVAAVRDLFEADYRKVTRTVDGVPFSLSVPRAGWEDGPDVRRDGKFRDGSLFISKSTNGQQKAEAVIFWAGFGGGGKAAPCANLQTAATGGSSAQVAAAVAMAPGTRVVKGPTLATVGGRPAQHVVLTVRKELGCDPGFFFTWRPRGPHGECWGACWLRSSVGDTVSVWIVNVGGTRLWIEAETRGSGRYLAQEIARIVGSISFD